MRPGAVQIAGVLDAEDAELIVACGVDFLGFPLGVERDLGDCSAAAAARIVRALPPGVEAVLITYRTAPREIEQLARRIGARWVQLHGAVGVKAVAELRRGAPDLHLAKSLIVRSDDPEPLEREVDAFGPFVEAFLTDTFDPGTGASGATGRAHDWAVSRALAARSPRPLVLAGGLTAENVRQAILEAGPAAVDAHTGVEGADGRKSRALLSRFVSEAHAGFDSRQQR